MWRHRLFSCMLAAPTPPKCIPSRPLWPRRAIKVTDKTNLYDADSHRLKSIRKQITSNWTSTTKQNSQPTDQYWCTHFISRRMTIRPSVGLLFVIMSSDTKLTRRYSTHYIGTVRHFTGAVGALFCLDAKLSNLELDIRLYSLRASVIN